MPAAEANTPSSSATRVKASRPNWRRVSVPAIPASLRPTSTTRSETGRLPPAQLPRDERAVGGPQYDEKYGEQDQRDDPARRAAGRRDAGIARAHAAQAAVRLRLRRRVLRPRDRRRVG